MTRVNTVGTNSVQFAPVESPPRHELSIAQNGGDVYIFAVEPILMTELSIRVGNADIPAPPTSQ